MFHTDRELYRDLRGGRFPKRRLPTISKTRSSWVLAFALRSSGMRVLLTDDNAAIKGASEKETHKAVLKLKLISARRPDFHMVTKPESRGVGIREIALDGFGYAPWPGSLFRWG
jgi:hypothetical protein